MMGDPFRMWCGPRLGAFVERTCRREARRIALRRLVGLVVMAERILDFVLARSGWQQVHRRIETVERRTAGTAALRRIRRKMAAGMCLALAHAALDWQDVWHAYLVRRLVRDYPCTEEPLVEADIRRYLHGVASRTDYRVIQRLAVWGVLRTPTRDEVLGALPRLLRDGEKHGNPSR